MKRWLRFQYNGHDGTHSRDTLLFHHTSSGYYLIPFSFFSLSTEDNEHFACECSSVLKTKNSARERERERRVRNTSTQCIIFVDVHALLRLPYAKTLSIATMRNRRFHLVGRLSELKNANGEDKPPKKQRRTIGCHFSHETISFAWTIIPFMIGRVWQKCVA